MTTATRNSNTRVVLWSMTLANAMILVDQTAVPLALPNIMRDFGVGSQQVQWVLNASLPPACGPAGAGWAPRGHVRAQAHLHHRRGRVYGRLGDRRPGAGVPGAPGLPHAARVGRGADTAEHGGDRGSGLPGTGTRSGARAHGRRVHRCRSTWTDRWRGPGRGLELAGDSRGGLPAGRGHHNGDAAAVPPDSADDRRFGIDLAGTILLTVSLISLVFGLSQSQVWGWAYPGVYLPLIIGVCTGVAFLRVERAAAAR